VPWGEVPHIIFGRHDPEKPTDVITDVIGVNASHDTGSSHIRYKIDEDIEKGRVFSLP
jgi:hypothetical protein